MIKVKADIKQIFKQGKNFTWPKPSRCPHCNDSRLWGHGFVLSFLMDLIKGVYLKRYRCPYCKTVFKLKPYGFFKRFQASLWQILTSIMSRLYTDRYLPNSPGVDSILVYCEDLVEPADLFFAEQEINMGHGISYGLSRLRYHLLF